MSNIDWRGYKVVAGIGAVMFGVAQAAVSFVEIAPMMTGGVVALLGGIYIIDQFHEQRDELATA